MKNITVSVDDELYHEARTEAARQRKSLSALVRECLSGLRQSPSKKPAIDPELARLFAMSDRIHKDRRDSVGPLNREELHERKAALKALWARIDATPELSGSVGPLNREELYQRGISRY